MSQPSREELQRLFIEADKAGNEEDARFFLSMLDQAPQQPQAQEPPGVVDIDRPLVGRAGADVSLGNAGRGFIDFQGAMADLPLRALDSVTDWQWVDSARDAIGNVRGAVREEGRRVNQSFNENAGAVDKAQKFVTDFLPFGAAATGPAKLSSLGLRITGQGAAAAATDAMLQRGEGAEDIDLGRTAMTAGFGAGAEAMAPILMRGFRAVRNMRGGNPVEKGRLIAQEAGLGDLPDEVLIKLSRASDEIDAGADPGAVLAKYEFDFDVSRGQMTRNTRQIQLEENLRETGPNAVTRADAQNIENMEQLRNRLTRNLDSPSNAVDRIQQSVQGAERAARNQTDEAWSAVRASSRGGPESSGARIPARFADDYRARVQQAWEAAGEVVEDSANGLNNKVARAVQSVSDTLENAVKKDGSIDFASIVAARKKFGTTYRSVDPGSRPALGIARQQFDDALSELTEDVLVSGSIDDIANMHKAIGHTREYKQLFENKGDKIGRAVMRMISDDNIGELTQAMLGDSPVTRPAALNYVRAVRQVLGDAPEAMDEFRRAVLYKAMTRRGDEVATMRSTAINLKEMMNGKNRAMMEELFSKRELGMISRFTQALDSMTFRPDKVGRNSGTPGGLIRAFRRMGERIPLFIGDMIGVLNNVSDARLARRAMSPVVPNPSIPALPGAAAATGQNRSTRPE